MSGFTFVGASTPWRSVSGVGGLSFGPGDSIESKAVSTARDVASKVMALREQAEGYAEVAYTHIDNCLNFSARVANVTYVSPTYTRAALEDGFATGTAPGVDDVSTPGFASFTPRLNTGTAESGSADAPVIGTLPDIGPVSSDLTFGAPSPPLAGGITLKPLPSISINIGDVPDVVPLDPPPVFDLEAVELSGDLEDLTIPYLDDSEIVQALDRLRSTAVGTIRIPRPDLVFPQVFEVAGSLLSGDLVVDAGSILSQSDGRVCIAQDMHRHALSRLWTDRGFEDQPAVSAYAEVVRRRSDEDAANNNAAAEGRWLDDSLLAAHTVGTAAHGMMIDLMLALDDLEFEALMTEAEARLEIARSVLAAYNGSAAVLRARFAQYEAEYTRLEMEAGRYRSRADIVQEQQKLNSAIADGFVAEERSKQTKAALFNAQIGGNEARVSALSSQMRALAANARALQVDAERYKGDVLQWEAQVELVRGQYKQARNNARMTLTKNQALETQVRTSQVRNDAIGVSARQAAIQTAAIAGQLRADIQQRSTAHVAATARNAVEAALPDIAASQYEAKVLSWTAELYQKVGLLDGVASEMSASARFFVSSAESESRAATISQQGKQQLAEAYRTAAEAAGRAGAAVESGRLSGYRATAAVSARASLGADENYAISASDNFTEQVSESDQKSVRIKE